MVSGVSEKLVGKPMQWGFPMVKENYLYHRIAEVGMELWRLLL